MILLSFYTSIEFYVILTVVAAAIVGISALPAVRTRTRQVLLSGRLYTADGWWVDNPLRHVEVVGAEVPDPALHIICNSDGTVTILRTGLEGIGSDGAVSASVNIAGFNVFVEERLTAGTRGSEAVVAAQFTLDCLGRERYFIRYDSEATGLSASATVNIRPGIHVARPLKQ